MYKNKHTHTISSLCLSNSWQRELAKYYGTEVISNTNKQGVLNREILTYTHSRMPIFKHTKYKHIHTHTHLQIFIQVWGKWFYSAVTMRFKRLSKLFRVPTCCLSISACCLLNSFSLKARMRRWEKNQYASIVLISWKVQIQADGKAPQHGKWIIQFN